MSDPDNYPLGYSEREAKRLADQASHVDQLTQDVLHRAGLKPGMRVLDIGSGAGDVSLLAARMVGPSGAVLGVDKAASSVEAARRRAADLGVANVRFEASDLAAFATDETFDALIGRFVLLYIPDRVGVLRKLARHLRPGAIVAFQDVDMSTMSEEPPSALFLQARRWLHEGFKAGGTELDMGAKLYATFLQAGWPTPTMIGVTPIIPGAERLGYESLVQVLRSLLPLIEQHGIATAAEMDLDTLAARLHADASANDRALFLSRIVGAWTRLA